MKNVFRMIGLIAIVAVIAFSFASCKKDGGDGGNSDDGGTSISGTFSYKDYPDYIITFEGKNFAGKWGGNEITGTFSVIDDKITIDYEGGKIVVTIIDNDTLLDPEGDIWNKKK